LTDTGEESVRETADYVSILGKTDAGVVNAHRSVHREIINSK